MKKIFTLSFAFLAVMLTSRAQIISVDPATHDVHIDVSEQGDALSYVYNNSSSTKTIRWVRLVEGTPAAWTSTVCDENNCYSTATSTKDFILNGGANGLLKLTVTPNETPGEGVFKVLVYDVNDSANANAIMIVNTVVENLTGVSDPVNGGVSIYPIPAKDFLNVKFEAVKNVSSVEIFNVVGQKLKVVNVSSEMKSVAVPVSDLKKGVYFVRVYSNGNDVITKTFTKE